MAMVCGSQRCSATFTSFQVGTKDPQRKPGCLVSLLYVSFTKSGTERESRHICASMPALQSVAFETVPMLAWLTLWQWPCLLLSRQIVNSSLFFYASFLQARGRDVLGFVMETVSRAPQHFRWLCAGDSVWSSSSTLQIFWDASHLWWLLCLPVYLPRTEDGSCTMNVTCQSGLEPFHVSLFVAENGVQCKSKAWVQTRQTGLSLVKKSHSVTRYKINRMHTSFVKTSLFFPSESIDHTTI